MTWTRREVLRLFGAAGVTLASGIGCTPSSGSGVFSDAERRALGALADAVIPPDSEPGGAALGAVAYIERLVTAFDRVVPAIFANGPFSGRQPFADAAGQPTGQLPADDFLGLVELDRVNAAAWRLSVFGSSALPGGAPNEAILGAVVGIRDQLHQGLAAAIAANRQAARSAVARRARDLVQLPRSAVSEPPDRAGLPRPRSPRPSTAATSAARAGRCATSRATVSRSATASGTARPERAPRRAADARPNPGADPEPLDADRDADCSTLVVSVLGGKVRHETHASSATRRCRRSTCSSSAPAPAAVRSRTCSTHATGSKVLVLEAGPSHFDGLDDPARQPVPRFSNDELKLAHSQLHRARPRRRAAHRGATPRATAIAPPSATCRRCRRRSAAARSTPISRCRASCRRTSSSARCSATSPARASPIGRSTTTSSSRSTRRASGCSASRARAGANPFEGRAARASIRCRPARRCTASLVVEQGLDALGYTMFPYPTAVNSMPYDGRPGVRRLRLLLRLRLPDERQGLAAVTMLRKALPHRQLSAAAPRRASSSSSRTARATQSTGVEALDPSGARVTFTADRYVLAASPIEDARLLLLSDPAGSGVGNSSGQVGRNLMFHFQTRRARHLRRARARPPRPHRRRTASPTSAACRTTPISRSAASSRSAAAGCPIGEAGYYERSRAAPAGAVERRALQGADAAEPGPRPRDDPRHAGRGRAAVDQPRRSRSGGRDLDGLPVARCTYQNHAFEPSASAFYRAEAARHPHAAPARTTRSSRRSMTSRARRTSWARCASATTRRPASATRTASSRTSATSTPPTGRCSRRRPATTRR